MLILWLVWAAMASSTFIMGMALAFMPPQGASVVPPEKVQGLLTFFGVMSVVVIAIAFFVRKKFCNDEIMKKAAKDYRKRFPEDNLEEIKDANGLGGTPIEAHVAKVIFPASAVCWALLESVAINGFVLAQQVKQIHVYFMFGMPAFFLLLAVRPTIDRLQAAIKSSQLEGF